MFLSVIILMMALNGCISTPATNHGSSNPGIIPGQSYILFYSTRDNLPGWYLMKSDGSNVQRFKVSKSDQYQIKGITWFSKLQLFVVDLADKNQQEDLYLLDINGEIRQRLTDTLYGKSDVTYSSEAQKFAFVCVESDLDICTVSKNGKNQLNLTHSPSREISPQWSKTGDQIIFSSNRSGVPGIWIVNADGNGLKSLSTVAVPESDPQISPNGQKIAFQTQRDRSWEIYVMDLNGQNLVNLTKNSAIDTEPKWSPDGNFIAFLSDRDNRIGVYVMDADGSRVVKISGSSDSQTNNFIWTPDSSAIIYSADVKNNFDIFSVSRDGKIRTNLTHSPAVDTDPQIVDLR